MSAHGTLVVLGNGSLDVHAPCEQENDIDTLVDSIVCPVLAILFPPDGDVPGVWDCPPYDEDYEVYAHVGFTAVLSVPVA